MISLMSRSLGYHACIHNNEPCDRLGGPSDEQLWVITLLMSHRQPHRCNLASTLALRPPWPMRLALWGECACLHVHRDGRSGQSTAGQHTCEINIIYTQTQTQINMRQNKWNNSTSGSIKSEGEYVLPIAFEVPLRSVPACDIYGGQARSSLWVSLKIIINGILQHSNHCKRWKYMYIPFGESMQVAIGVQMQIISIYQRQRLRVFAEEAACAKQHKKKKKQAGVSVSILAWLV